MFADVKHGGFQELIAEYEQFYKAIAATSAMPGNRLISEGYMQEAYSSGAAPE